MKIDPEAPVEGHIVLDEYDIACECGRRQHGERKMRPVGSLTIRAHFAAEFTKAWIVALGARHELTGWSDDSASAEANRLGILQADRFISALNQQDGGKQ
jgi:hypothetical protein